MSTKYDKNPRRVKKHKITPQMRASAWPKGVSGNPGGRPKGMTLLKRIRQVLRKERHMDDNGNINTNFEIAAQSFVKMMREGSFAHTKEVIDREEGRIPTRVADANGQPLKLFVGMPTEGEDAP